MRDLALSRDRIVRLDQPLSDPDNLDAIVLRDLIGNDAWNGHKAVAMGTGHREEAAVVKLSDHAGRHLEVSQPGIKTAPHCST